MSHLDEEFKKQESEDLKSLMSAQVRVLTNSYVILLTAASLKGRCRMLQSAASAAVDPNAGHHFSSLKST